ncbi:unnamed protein product, partial [Urochloa humidicola]
LSTTTERGPISTDRANPSRDPPLPLSFRWWQAAVGSGAQRGYRGIWARRRWGRGATADPHEAAQAVSAGRPGRLRRPRPWQPGRGRRRLERVPDGSRASGGCCSSSRGICMGTDMEIFLSRMVGGAGALRYSALLRSPVLHDDGGLDTEGLPSTGSRRARLEGPRHRFRCQDLRCPVTSSRRVIAHTEPLCDSLHLSSWLVHQESRELFWCFCSNIKVQSFVDLTLPPKKGSSGA